MDRGLIIKIALVVVLLGWAAYKLYPTFQYWPMDKEQWHSLQISDKERFDELQATAIKRGLDLQGGVFLVLEVDPKNELESSELTDAVEGARRVIEQRVNQYGVSEANVQKIGERRLIIELPGLEDIEAAMNLVGRTALLRFNLMRPTAERDEIIRRIDAALPRLIGDAVFAVDDSAEAALGDAGLSTDATSQAAEEVESASSGAFEPDAPEGFEPEAAADTAALVGDVTDDNPLRGVASLSGLMQGGQGGDLYVSLVNRPKAEAILALVKERNPGLIPRVGVFIFGKGETLGRELAFPLHYLASASEMTGASVEDARVGKSSGLDLQQAGRSIVKLTVKSDSVRVFANITRRNVGERLAIILDDIVYSAPTIKDHIRDGSSEISGMEDREEARTLAIAIRSGALPAAVEIQEQRYVGPSLGADSIESSKIAMTIGGALVILFILGYYRIAGGVAIAGLGINMVLLMACLAGLQGTLTLPGVAGLLLTIGMAVDANVLIFERIREELATGKSARASIEAGYERAATAIWDANITTFITAAVLYQYGSGPVRGFALILGIGIFTSVFSALFVTRMIYEYWLTGRRVRGLSIGRSFIAGTNFRFMGMKNAWLTTSGVLMVVSILLITVVGFNWGGDFSGGTRLEVRLNPPVEMSEVRSSLSNVFVAGKELDLSRSEIKTVDRETDILITVKQFPEIDAATIDRALRAHLAARFPNSTTGDWVLNAESVGPKIGSELKGSAVWAVLIALLGILAYVSIRFERAFAVAATAALFHDVLFTLGVFSLIRHEITLAVVAAVLTIVGYSLNDTIVVFDRIREGLKREHKRLSYQDILDKCINETLSRTLITSGTTLIVVVVLQILGGEILRDFALALMVGVLVGTYSSIYIASALVMAWHDRQERLETAASRAKAEQLAAAKRGGRSKTVRV